MRRTCENEWPDYRPDFDEPVHPIACSCSGRGSYNLTFTGQQGTTTAVANGSLRIAKSAADGESQFGGQP